MKKGILLILLALCLVNFTAPVCAVTQGYRVPTLDGPPGEPAPPGGGK